MTVLPVSVFNWAASAASNFSYTIPYSSSENESSKISSMVWTISSKFGLQIYDELLNEWHHQKCLKGTGVNKRKTAKLVYIPNRACQSPTRVNPSLATDTTTPSTYTGNWNIAYSVWRKTAKNHAKRYYSAANWNLSDVVVVISTFMISVVFQVFLTTRRS